ncbi:hypothetical protein [Streptomyces anulatus]|uniref:hypothetical protein n=1 Tax=Streptomyces anulatus TaxID=1892 RepID=UPI00331EF984
MNINYDGRRFRKLAADDGVTAGYRQTADLIWANFSGGPIRRGNVNGICGPDGTLRFAYTMVMDGGDVIVGHAVSTPERDADGVLVLREEWERYGPHADSGVSYLAEVTDAGDTR